MYGVRVGGECMVKLFTTKNDFNEFEANKNKFKVCELEFLAL